MKTPREFGLPDKFDSWRPAQAEALRMLSERDVRIQATEAPTGFGKSPVIVAHALRSGLPTAIVTESRALQDQYLRDFQCIGMTDLRGRRNYECQSRPDWTCEEGYAGRCLLKGTVQCPSSQAEMRAASSSLIVTNYDKWTANKKFGMGLEHIQQVIFDEAHVSPDALARAMQVTLRDREIGGLLGLDFPDPRLASEMVNWKGWASGARGDAERLMLRLKADIQHTPKPSWVREYLHVRQLVKRLATLATARPEDWVVDEVKDGYQFDPIRAGRYAEGALFLKLPKVLFFSATLRPKTLYLLGLPKTGFLFREFDSEFDPARCPIYYVPTLRVDARTDDLSALWVKLDQIAARRADRKGIVHTISFARRDEILRVSRFSSRMLINPRGEAATGIVDEFRGSPDGTILVSPSVGAGFDFPGRQCEWQFVCKIPFPDGRSKVMRARQADDSEYGPYQAMSKLVQIVGRGMRSPQDACENFIPDMHLDWFMPRYKHLAPKWFKHFFRRVDTLPAPPPRV